MSIALNIWGPSCMVNRALADSAVRFWGCCATLTLPLQIVRSLRSRNGAYSAPLRGCGTFENSSLTAARLSGDDSGTTTSRQSQLRLAILGEVEVETLKPRRSTRGAERLQMIAFGLGRSRLRGLSP